ncbi:hypothetical protein IU11_06720 [Cellulosimicrobium sp. MM]|nr:hypothetical protein IU11_06720 [Cellulosimicrobium sp. MM]
MGEPDLAREPEVDQGEPEREVHVSVRALADVPVGVAGQSAADALLEGGALLALELGRVAVDRGHALTHGLVLGRHGGSLRGPGWFWWSAAGRSSARRGCRSVLAGEADRHDRCGGVTWADVKHQVEVLGLDLARGVGNSGHGEPGAARASRDRGEPEHVPQSPGLVLPGFVLGVPRDASAWAAWVSATGQRNPASWPAVRVDQHAVRQAWARVYVWIGGQTPSVGVVVVMVTLPAGGGWPVVPTVFRPLLAS